MGTGPFLPHPPILVYRHISQDVRGSARWLVEQNSMEQDVIAFILGSLREAFLVGKARSFTMALTLV